MQYIEAPYACELESPGVFLAGGITGAEPWQTRLTAMLCESPWTVINPRRQHYPMGDPAVGREQIAWEHEYLERASLIAFWFPPKTLCPITLFELGVATRMNKPILVGTHRSYPRRFDVETQLRLRRPEVRVVKTLGQLAARIIEAYPTERDTNPTTNQRETIPCEL